VSDAAPVVADAPVSTSTPPGDASEPVATPPVTPPPKEAAPPPKRTLKAKVYGEERELSADAVEGLAKELGIPPEFVLRNLQTSAAAQKRMQEVAEKEKAWEARTAKFKADPWAMMKEEAGLDPDQAAVERVRKLMEQEAMSPEQRAVAEYQRKNAEMEAKLKAIEEERTQGAQKAETDRVIATLNTAIPAAAEAAGLPRSPAVGRMMVEFMLSQARAGVDVNPEDAAQYARENVQGWTGEVLKSMNEEQIITFLGPEVVKKILTHSVNKVRGTQAAPAVVPATTSPKGPPKKMSTDEWRKWMES
jgi:hypothetical protein